MPPELPRWSSRLPHSLSKQTHSLENHKLESSVICFCLITLGKDTSHIRMRIHKELQQKNYESGIQGLRK